MRQDGTSVKSFTYGLPTEIRAKVAFLMAHRGVRLEGLHRLLEDDPSKSMVCYVINAAKKSAPLEARIATVLGVTREEAFGPGPLSLWRAA